jgi:hypothetical protein
MLISIYSRWLKANALPEIGANELTLELWGRVTEERKSGSALRMLKMRGQLAWLDRFCYIWQTRIGKWPSARIAQRGQAGAGGS